MQSRGASKTAASTKVIGRRKAPQPNYSKEEDSGIIEETIAVKAYRTLAKFEHVSNLFNSRAYCLDPTTNRSVRAVLSALKFMAHRRREAAKFVGYH
eukprot:IDg17323t1